jgi:class 3 adenylate cyclase
LRQWVGEIERRYSLLGHPGKFAVTGFLARERMGSFADAIQLANEIAEPADIAAVRRYQSRSGLSFNIENLVLASDAERAVRTSLDLITAVASLKTRTTLQTRVVIATGLVVVGDVVDAGGSQERGIIGETPNLAARGRVSPSLTP